MNYVEMRRVEYIKAAIFSTLLLITAFALLCFAFSQNQKMILGSELNSDGTIEYLCLGTDCDHLAKLDW